MSRQTAFMERYYVGANYYHLLPSLTNFLKFDSLGNIRDILCRFVRFEHDLFLPYGIQLAFVKWHENNRS